MTSLFTVQWRCLQTKAELKLQEHRSRLAGNAFEIARTRKRSKQHSFATLCHVLLEVQMQHRHERGMAQRKNALQFIAATSGVFPLAELY